MLFECSRYDLRNEIILGIHDLFQAGPYPAAGVDHGLPVEVGEHLHDRVEEGLLIIMMGPVRKFENLRVFFPRAKPNTLPSFCAL